MKIVVKWDVTSVLADCTFEDPEFSNRTLELVVDSGTGARPYSDYPRDRERLSGGCALRPGDSLVTNYVLLRGWYAEPGGPSGDSDPDKLVTPFAAPGRHSVRVAYVTRREHSNAVMFEVAAPVRRISPSSTC